MARVSVSFAMDICVFPRHPNRHPAVSFCKCPSSPSSATVHWYNAPEMFEQALRLLDTGGSHVAKNAMLQGGGGCNYRLYDYLG